MKNKNKTCVKKTNPSDTKNNPRDKTKLGYNNNNYKINNISGGTQKNTNIMENMKKKNNNINNTNTKNSQTEKCNVPDSIFELFIRMYYLYKNIRDKIKSKSPLSEEYYFIDYEFLNMIKNRFKYFGICKELEKYNYNEYELDSKINNLISSIKQKGIIKEKVPLDNIKILPKEKKIKSTLHLINFCLVNEKIINVIKTIKLNFGLTQKVSSNKHLFYYKPQLFYKGPNFLKIGDLDYNDIFQIHYFISLDLTNSLLTNILFDLQKSESVEDYFKSKNIDINQKESHDLIICYQKRGTVVNFKLIQGINQNIIHKEINDNFSQDDFSNIPDISTEISNEIDLSYLDKFDIKSFHEIEITPMIGLQNIGQTCYMNAALQCFSNTKALTNYFLNYKNLDILKCNSIIMNESSEPSLVIEYLKLIRHLWCDKPKSYFAPYDFKSAIGKIDSLFKNFEANDAKDFVNFMVMRMHEELNFVDNSLVKAQNLIEPQMPLNPYNQMQVLQSYLYDFQLNFSSFISNCFYGTTQGEFECQNCKMKLYQTGQNIPLIKYNYQTFFFLNFPLAEVSKYILSNQMIYMKYMKANVNPNIAVDLMDCFYYYQKDEILGCYCDGCQNNNAQVVSRTKLYVAPIYLIILLNRGKGIEFNIKIMFPEFFDTKGIFINPTGVYQLYGVVKHFGESSSAGHFTAYCRSPIDNRWYFYNDATVTPVDEREKYRIQEEGLTYMLFYSKMK